MDKDQNNLLKTYLRKRNVAVDQAGQKLQKYEMDYYIKNKDKYDIENMDFGYYYVVEDIIKHPERIPSYDFKNDDPRLINDMYVVLEYYPEFAKLFSLHKLTPYRRRLILKIVPEKIAELTEEELNEFSIYDKEILVEENPSFIKYFPLDEFDGYRLRNILIKHPKLIKSVDTSKMDTWDLGQIIGKHPEVLDYFDVYSHPRAKYVIGDAVAENPNLLKRFDPKDIDGTSIGRALDKRPDLINLIDVTKIKVADKYQILYSYPNLVKYFNLDDMTYFLDSLVGTHPELINFVNIKELPISTLSSILQKQPRLINKIMATDNQFDEYLKYSESGKNDVKILLKLQPQLKPYFEKYLTPNTKH